MKILLIDHHELFRAGLSHVLRKLPTGIGELFEADDWEAGLRRVEQHPDLDLVLLELNAHGCNGANSVKYFRERYPRIPLVVVSGEEDFHVIHKVLNYGASGFVGKSAPETTLLSALKQVFAGDIYVPKQMLQHLSGIENYRLTKRQTQILECLAEGLSNKAISERLNLSEGTVKVHLAAVYQALRVRSRTEAVQVASHHGLLDTSDC
jgi:DNA-binding NarL/FixJ family response regulator